MLLSDFYQQTDGGLAITRQQGSDFAKQIARDFNPLHDVDNSRFCVPGDLLFALSLNQYGVSQSMTFDFKGMVGGDAEIEFSATENKIRVVDGQQKDYLLISREGVIQKDPRFIEALTLSYVAFSGKTFPHILVELMEQQGVMINPQKPMVIYDQMSLEFERFVEGEPAVVLKSSEFEVTGKRGMVTMNFDIQVDAESIGSGEKQIIMSGLRPFERAGVDRLVEIYDERRLSYGA